MRRTIKNAVSSMKFFFFFFNIHSYFIFNGYFQHNNVFKIVSDTTNFYFLDYFLKLWCVSTTELKVFFQDMIWI